jgi:hypothetical protein
MSGLENAENDETRKERVVTGFALMLETACEDFEIMQRLISGQLSMVSQRPVGDVRASPRISMALAKSFVFHVVRARRICACSPGLLRVDRVERNRFAATTAKALGVRDVNEHGFEADAESRPSLHFHHAEDALLDETSMVTLAPNKILMGPVNLFDLYGPTDRMRKLAGFSALRSLRHPLSGPAPLPSP